MKATTLISICLVSGLAAAAQTTPPSQRVTPNTAKPTAKAAVVAARPGAAVKKAPTAKPAAVKQAAAKAPAKAPGKRDPFISPIRVVEGGGSGCSTGKKCLAIDAIKLIGIARTTSGPIALIGSTSTPYTYFLRESDPVFNGYVVKITATSIVFRENVMDRTGKVSTRDIVRTVSAPPV
jgi:hypothetical protein